VKPEYESTETIASQKWPGVRFTLRKMSFTRRVDLMRRIRELAGRVEFLEAGERPEDKMDAGLLRAEIDRIYLDWGLAEVSGLEIDGEAATPGSLIDRGPEELMREALELLKASAGLNEAERKN
jgi:hypothetical protein